MKQQVNKVYKPLFLDNSRYTILMGGRGAGRSTVASQYGVSKLVSDEYFRCAIMRYILGDIRNSIYREMVDRLEESNDKDKVRINESNMSITYGRNTINAVGFKKSSGDQKAKLKSLANYNCIIIEEADEIPEEDFIQLDDSLRTIKGDIKIILLLNPPAKNHWIIKRWFDLEETEKKGYYIPRLKEGITDTTFIRSSYEDNRRNIDANTLERYEKYRDTKPEHFYNMIKGYVPENVRGRVYNNWKIIDVLPHEARLELYGLDFGYTNDPTAIVGVYYYNGGYIIDEKCYQTGLTNPMIANLMNKLDKGLIVADSAEPKSISELQDEGLMITAVEKGADSIRNGIQVVQDQKISITARSKNIIREYENYAWDENKDGESLNKPKDKFNHSMDAIRYAVSSLKKSSGIVEAQEKQSFGFKLKRKNMELNSTR